MYGLTKERLVDQIQKLDGLETAATLKLHEAESYYIRSKKELKEAKEELECHQSVKT